jgi:hypothetical protein
MDKTSVNRSEYSNTRSERYDVKRPTDSNLLKSDDRMQGQSHSSSEFGVKKGDRFESKKHGSSDIWKVRFRMADLKIVAHGI